MEFPTFIGRIHFEFKGYWVVIYIFIQILKVHSLSKQLRPWSDATFCRRVWSGSQLFPYVLQKGRQAYMG